MNRGLGAAPAPPASLHSEGVDRPWHNGSGSDGAAMAEIDEDLQTARDDVM